MGITGNFDTPGGNRGATAATFDEEFAMMGSGLPMASADLWDKVLGVEDIPLLKHHGIWADSTAIWDACNNEGAPYPLYGGVCQSGDVMNMSNALWGWEGLKKLDFLLDIDLWHTPTSQLADILLPARHWLEVDCPRRSQGSGGMEGADGSYLGGVEAGVSEDRFPRLQEGIPRRLGHLPTLRNGPLPLRWQAGLADAHAQAGDMVDHHRDVPS